MFDAGRLAHAQLIPAYKTVYGSPNHNKKAQYSQYVHNRYNVKVVQNYKKKTAATQRKKAINLRQFNIVTNSLR